MSSKFSIDSIIEKSQSEHTKYGWEGTFRDYLTMIIENPSLSRLSHSLVHESITSQGIETDEKGREVYSLFEDNIFGLDETIDRIVRYFAASAKRLEVRKRILLLLGPPASGKSSVVDILKRALEDYSKTSNGAVYAIKGCPMQEDPLHLVPKVLRQSLFDSHGIYIEGDLCPRCLYMVRTEYLNDLEKVPIERVIFSEPEAVGIGMFIATDPNPDGATSLIGSVDPEQLAGDRGEVAGKAFRLDGELNIANRGLIEFVEMFKADRHLLTTLLGLAQEQIIKNEKFGSLYADEVIIGHSNEKDFDAFALEPTSEALRDRIVAIQVPYTLKVSEEVKIYQKMMKDSNLEGIELAPLTLTMASVFTVLSRFEDRVQGGITLIDKMHLYDGELPKGYSLSDIQEVKRRYPNEGMFGISPRYTMNRIGVLASSISGNCITPLAVLDSLWRGQMENVSTDTSDNLSRYTLLLQEGVNEYSRLAIKEVQRAYDSAFEDTAQMLVDGYVKGAAEHVRDGGIRTSTREDTVHLREQDMREMERVIGVTERDKDQFRKEINLFANKLEEKEIKFTYLAEPRLRNAIEERLLPTRRNLERSLARPRFAKQRAEWSQRRAAIISRLVLSYGYSDLSARDLLDFVTEVLKKKSAMKILKHGGIEWLWPLYLSPPDVNGENQ